MRILKMLLRTAGALLTAERHHFIETNDPAWENK